MREIDNQLIEAAEKGDLEGVKESLENGADINSQDEFFRNTALHIACDNGHLEVVEFLVENEADHAIMNGTDMTPLHMAVRNGHGEIVRYICDKELPLSERILNDVLTVAGMSVYSNDAIYKMVYDYRIKVVRPSPKESGDSNELLLVSSENGDINGVRKALEDGADPNTIDDRGMRPLLWASLRGHYEVVKLLLEKGAGVNETNHADWTPLMEAAMEGHIDIVKFLIKNGADVNAKTFVSGTALMFSSGNGHIEVVKFLLESGADLSIQIEGAEDDEGMTALDYAIQYGRSDVVQLLKKYAA